MKILLINRFWADSHVPTGRMLFDMAKALANNENSVTVLTSGDTYVNVSGEIGTLDRLEVVRVRSFGPRTLRWVIFWVVAVVRPLFMSWDRCVVLTDPPFMNFFAIWDHWIHGNRRKRYWWVMDLFPEMISASGVIRRKGIVDRLLRFLTNLSLKSLDGVIVLDEAQRKRLSAYGHWKTADEFSTLVPPWDFREIRAPSDTRNRFVELTGLSNRTIILYAGNLGRAHAFEPLVEAAKELLAREQNNWVFVFACRGYKRKQLEKAAAGVPNIRVIDYVPPDVTSDMLFAASAHVITLGKGWQGICIPSKLYGILPTQKPVLFIGPADSGTALAIVKHQSGAILPPDAIPAEIIRTLEEIVSRPSVGLYSVDRIGPEKIVRFITRP